MKTLREALDWAKEKGVALGHFNVSDSTQYRAIIAAAQELSVPVIIGVSEGEREFIGEHEVAALVAAARAQGIPVFLNADHTHTVEGCKGVIDAGFDAVIYDGAKGSLEENVAQTQEVVAYAGSSGREVLVEAELGYIGTSSRLLDEVPDDVVLSALPSAETAASFVAATHVDLLAPAVGNIHGMLRGRSNPALSIEHVTAIAGAVTVPLVLHGGSGITDDDFRAAIAAGMRIVHINTEIRAAYRGGIETGLAADKDEISPYRYLAPGYEAVKQKVLERLRLFSTR